MIKGQWWGRKDDKNEIISRRSRLGKIFLQKIHVIFFFKKSEFKRIFFMKSIFKGIFFFVKSIFKENIIKHKFSFFREIDFKRWAKSFTSLVADLHLAGPLMEHFLLFLQFYFIAVLFLFSRCWYFYAFKPAIVYVRASLIRTEKSWRIARIMHHFAWKNFATGLLELNIKDGIKMWVHTYISKTIFSQLYQGGR